MRQCLNIFVMPLINYSCGRVRRSCLFFDLCARVCACVFYLFRSCLQDLASLKLKKLIKSKSHWAEEQKVKAPEEQRFMSQHGTRGGVSNPKAFFFREPALFRYRRMLISSGFTLTDALSVVLDDLLLVWLIH